MFNRLIDTAISNFPCKLQFKNCAVMEIRHGLGEISDLERSLFQLINGIGLLFEDNFKFAALKLFKLMLVFIFFLQPVQRDVEVLADEEQIFLQKLQTQLAKQPQASATSSSQRVGICTLLVILLSLFFLLL